MTNPSVFAEYGFTCHGAEHRLSAECGYFRAYQSDDGRWRAELVPRDAEPIAIRNGATLDFDDSIMAALACLAYEVEQEIAAAEMEQVDVQDLTPPSRSPMKHDMDFLGQS